MDSNTSGGSVKGVLIMFLIASLVAMSEARGRTIVVGDSEIGWRSGTNYTDWVIQNSPFYINDILVFKYPAPNKSTAPQNLYLLPNMWSYITCDFKEAKLLASATQGTGNGFKIELNQWRPYYLASSESNAIDCISGLTKFVIVPFPSWY